MRRHLLSCLTVAALLTMLAIGGCGGSGKRLPAGSTRIPLPPIDFTITLPPNAGIDASAVGFERLRLQEALNEQRTPSDLPTDFRMVEAFVITPETYVLPDYARVRLVPEESLPTGTRLFLFRVSESRHCTPIDDGFVKEDGSISFETKVFGFFVVAENTLIARPSEQFICFAFATIGEGPLPLTVDFNAIALGGKSPITFTWDMGDGSDAIYGDQVTHTFDEIGEYSVSVFGTDDNGAVSNSFSTVISVTEGFMPLQSVSVTVLPTSVDRPNERHFIPEVVGGTPPYSWSWEFSDGFTSAEMDPIHEFASAGLYSGTVTVVDSTEATVHKSFVADIRRIILTADKTFGYFPMEVSFNVLTEGLGAGATNVIDYGDGVREQVDTASAQPYLHTFGEAGTYHVVVESWENFAGSLQYVYSQPVDIVVVEAPAPIVYSIFPQQAQVGNEVIVFGVDFGALHDASDKVVFSPNEEAQIVQWTDSSIKVVVPSTAVDGDLFVSRDEQGVAYESNKMFFNVIEQGQQEQPPILVLLSPSQGPVGTVVTIFGSNFGATQGSGDSVAVGPYNMPVLAWSANAIDAEIPQYAVSGDIVVTQNGLASNGLPFLVGNFPPGNPPFIDTISPVSGVRGSEVKINGSNFGARLPNSVVFLGGTPMAIIAWTETQIRAIVPTSAMNAEIRVYQWGVLSNPVPFAVKPSPPSIYGIDQL
jgi:PKD repeat protein